VKVLPNRTRKPEAQKSLAECHLVSSQMKRGLCLVNPMDKKDARLNQFAQTFPQPTAGSASPRRDKGMVVLFQFGVCNALALLGDPEKFSRSLPILPFWPFGRKLMFQ